MSAPGWSKRELDAEFGPMEPAASPVVVPSVLSRWFVGFKDDVLAGRVSLEELLEVADADMQQEPPMCPVCSRPARDRYTHAVRSGTCGVCYLHRLRDAHLEAIAELEAKREVAAAKKERQRLRDEAEPDRPRSHAPFRTCESCGERLPRRHLYDSNVCPACLELRERRQSGVTRALCSTKTVESDGQESGADEGQEPGVAEPFDSRTPETPRSVS